jgi:DUF2892 family protein
MSAKKGEKIMAFAKNEGSLDRIIRFVVGAGIIAYVFMAGNVAPSSVVGIIAIIVGVVLLLTSIVGFCPAYKILGIQTGGKE